jgi:hypothetical protein
MWGRLYIAAGTVAGATAGPSLWRTSGVFEYRTESNPLPMQYMARLSRVGFTGVMGATIGATWPGYLAFAASKIDAKALESCGDL